MQSSKGRVFLPKGLASTDEVRVASILTSMVVQLTHFTIITHCLRFAMAQQQVPSSPYQFSRWYELQGGEEVRGSCLNSPRIREGPANVTSGYATHALMYGKKGKDWKDFRNTAEDWENTSVSTKYNENCLMHYIYVGCACLTLMQSVNLSYQDLGEAYQRSELLRCLSRLVHCTHLQLTDNSLTDLSKVTFPKCMHLNLSRNRFSSVKKLPSAPNLQHLSLADNHFTSIPSLALKYPNLKSLHFKGNPTEYSTQGYRVK